MEKNWAPKIIKGARVNLLPIDRDCMNSYAQKVVRLAAGPEPREDLKFFSFFQEPLTLGRQLRFFSRMIESQNNQIFAVETKSGRFIGTCGLHDVDRVNDNLRLGIIIFDRQYRKKGFGREVLNLLLRFCFESLRMNKVYLTARADNELSTRIYGKLGFKEEGVMRKEYKVKDGQFIDLLRMSILKSEWQEKGGDDENPDS